MEGRVRLRRSLAGSALVLGSLAIFGGGASAQPVATQCPLEVWQVRDWNPNPGPTQSSTIVDTEVRLTKPAPTTGTSMESTNLGIALDAGETLSVDYALSGGASTSAGAVRLFYYDHPDGDTAAEAPTDFAFAPDGPISGTLSLTIPSDLTVGTVGVTYDASNASTGTVTFENLIAGDTLVQLTPCAVENLHATDRTASSISLGWNPWPGAIGYQVTRSGGGVALRTTAAHTSRSLQPNTMYHFTVAAIDEFGNIGTPAHIDVSTTNSVATPTAFRISETRTAITLGWTQTPGATHWYLSRVGGGSGVLKTTRQHTSSNLQPDTVYTFRIRAAAGTGDNEIVSPAETINIRTRP